MKEEMDGMERKEYESDGDVVSNRGVLDKADNSWEVGKDKKMRNGSMMR